MRRLTVLGLALAMVWLPMSGGGPAAAAGPWFVATTGDDANDCLSPATPCLTIDGAIGKAAAGDVVYVAVGVYTGSDFAIVNIDRDITLLGGWNSAFDSVVGYSILDGQNARRGINIPTVADVLVERFSIVDGIRMPGQGEPGGGVSVRDANVVFSDVTVSNVEEPAFDIGFSTVTIENSSISDVWSGEVNWPAVHSACSSLTLDAVVVENAAHSGVEVVCGNTATTNETVIVDSSIQSAGRGVLFDSLAQNGLSIARSVFDGNSVGIANVGIAGYVHIVDSTISNSFYAGIENGTPMTITNTTISGNQIASISDLTGAVINVGSLVINNSTITDNQRNGIYTQPGGVTTLGNTILAGNGTQILYGGECAGSGSILSNGHNLFGDLTDCIISPNVGDQSNVLDPELGPLQDNGGPTPTHALSGWGPAVDAGDPATCEATDQRGVARPQGLVCDIGAFELTNPPPRPLPDGGRFFDDDGNVHEASIEAIAAEGITRGCNPPYQTGYCPNRPVTRGQMAAFLVRALSLPPSSEDRFTDDAGSIFEADIAALAAAGITRGCNPPANTLFCPGRAVTRGQMAAFLVRALHYPATPADIFDDDNDSVFEADINALGKAGVTLGCNPPRNNNFCPDQAVTRAQMASFLTRALSLPVRKVPARQASLNGVDLEVFAVANGAGCTLRDGETCIISQNVKGEFHIFTGWLADNWSTMTASERANFESNKLRVVARFDGVPIGLVAWEIEVIADTAYKTYSFQFPSWLVGNHILEIDYIDDTENYLWTVHDNLTTSGGGYPQSVEPTAAATVEPIDRTGGHLPAR